MTPIWWVCIHCVTHSHLGNLRGFQMSVLFSRIVAGVQHFGSRDIHLHRTIHTSPSVQDTPSPSDTQGELPKQTTLHSLHSTPGFYWGHEIQVIIQVAPSLQDILYGVSIQTTATNTACIQSGIVCQGEFHLHHFCTPTAPCGLLRLRQPRSKRIDVRMATDFARG